MHYGGRSCMVTNCDTYKISKDENAAHLVNGLNELRKEGTFCDVTLKVGDRAIRAHKIVICMRSPYFMAKLSGKSSESNEQEQEISIKDIDADSLDLLIEYMYTGKLNVDYENVKNLLLTASLLKLPSAVEICSSALRHMINMDNCIQYVLFARTNSLQNILDSSIRAAVNNFRYIVYRDEYLELEFDVLKRMTQSLMEKGFPEDLVYSFLMRWINHSREARINHFDDLLQLMNPSIISPNVLHSSKIGMNSNPIFAAWANTTRPPTDTGELILVSRKGDTFHPLRLNIYSEETPCTMHTPCGALFDGSFVCNGYYIYHQGGQCSTEVTNEAFFYHPISRSWNLFVPLQQARAYHRSCELNGRIYSVGGSDGSKALASVEFVDLCTGQRGFTDPLPRAKWRTGLAVHENVLYNVGGNERGTPCKCIHRIDEREGVWQELAPSPYIAGTSSCGLIGESIYCTHLGSLQRYDIRANDWAMISAEYKRYPSEVFAINNTLFGLFKDHVGRFTPDKGRWEIQRMLDCSFEYSQVSTNLLIPNLNK